MSSHGRSSTAKILYRPFGLFTGVLAGFVAGQIFRQAWRRVDPDDQEGPPRLLQSDQRLSKVLVAALIEGAVFSVVRASVDRGGARLFERWTGKWPGD